MGSEVSCGNWLLLLQGKTKAEFLKAEGKDYEANLVAAGVTAAEEDLRDYHDRITNGSRGWVLARHTAERRGPTSVVLCRLLCLWQEWQARL